MVDAALHYECGILRGLTWSQFGYVALMALAFGAPMMVAIVRTGTFPNAILTAAINFGRELLAGLLVLLGAVVLTNIKPPRIPRPVTLGTAVVMGCALGAWLWTWLIAPTGDIFSTGVFVFRLRTSLLEWGLIAAAYYFIERSRLRAAELREAELDRHRIEAQMLEARLQVLQAQVEPHFLFNTLAHVQRLYQTDPTRGRSMLDSFCDYVRAALPQMRGSSSTLGREVELGRAYLDTQMIRMGRRLRFEIEIPDELLAAVFPPMMLLSLVENAIKHGLNPLPDGGSIRIAAVSDDGRLRLIVTDTGAGPSTAGHRTGSGVGLSNIRSRLAALYGARARLTLGCNVPHGVIVAIEIPLSIHEDEDSDGEGTRLSATAADSRWLGRSG